MELVKNKTMRRRILPLLTKRNVIIAVVGIVLLFSCLRSSSLETMDHDLTFLRRSRNLRTYVYDIENILIAPIIPPCQELDIPLVALVTTAPGHRDERLAIRSTWGTAQPTFFFMGVSSDHYEEQLKEMYIEAAQFDDIIITNFIDNYDNLTLKTASLMSWSLTYCPQAHFVMKVDDDVLVNPWTLEKVLKDHEHASMLGLRYDGHPSIRDPRDKWYLPDWLFPDNVIPEFLAGPSYIIRGAILFEIYEAAFEVSLINIEDVFYTYLVAKRTLGLNLTNDDRMHSYYPKLGAACSYWPLATVHRQDAATIRNIFPKLKSLAHSFKNNVDNCNFWNIVVDAI